MRKAQGASGVPNLKEELSRQTQRVQRPWGRTGSSGLAPTLLTGQSLQLFDVCVWFACPQAGSPHVPLPNWREGEDGGSYPGVLRGRWREGLGSSPPHHESAGPWGSHHQPPAGSSVPGIKPRALLTPYNPHGGI